MAYLPGVPDMVAPASPAPTILKPGATSIGKPSGIGAIASAVGKPGRTEHLGTVVGRRGAGLTSVGGGNQMAHSLNHYGKNPPALMGGAQTPGGVDPTVHPGVKMIRGGDRGQMSGHIRSGGLGPGKMSTPGRSGNYSMSNNEDVE